MGSTIQEYLASLRGKRVAVLGIGVSNTPLIKMLLRADVEVTACDKRQREDFGGQAEEFLERLWALIGWLLPRYEEEGKTALVIAVGCTGGHHRSVAIAHALAERIRGQGWPVAESHRDLGRN